MNLLLLTKYFPYGTGEAFIENEIGTAAGYFDRILIIPCEADTGAKMRKIPENASVFAVPAVSKKDDVLAGIPAFFSKDDSFKKERKECGGFLQEGFLSYFEAKCRRVFHAVIDSGALSSIVSDDYILYSYWLFTTARVGELIADVYPPEKMISRAHRYDLYEERNSLHYLPYRKEFLSRYTNVYPCSENGEKYLKEKYPEKGGKIKAAFLGTVDYGPGKGSSDGIFRIASCSRVEDVKRVPRILSALKILDKKLDGKKIKWRHMGGGSGWQELVKEIQGADLQNISCSAPGDMPNASVMAFYKENPVDLFVNVSSSEGLPVSIMEAQSFGIPAVATDVGGTGEIAINGVTGRLLPENFTDEELADAISFFMQNGEAGEMRPTVRAFWASHFKADDNYRAFYDEICDKK